MSPEDTFKFQALETKNVVGIEVFSVGTWTDSSGQINEWTKVKVQAMAENFRPGTIPLKIGHTSKEFNSRIAAALGVPVEMFTGDTSGHGQMALGTISKLSFRDGKLFADFEGVPAPLADLIEGGQYKSVSSEIEIDSEGKSQLTAVALLGMEKPAVENLAGLEAAKIFGKNDNRLVLTFQKGGNTMDKFTRDTRIKDFLSLFQEGNADALTAIAVALGLDPQTASLANVLKAITDLKAGGAGMMPPEAVAEQKAAFSKAQNDLTALTKTVEMQQATITTFEHERRVSKYTKLAEGWRGIPGKSDDIGVQLADTEEKAGEKVAQMVIAQFQAANKAVENAGVLKSIGTARQSDGNSEAEKKILEFQKSGLSKEKSYLKLAKEHKSLFRELQASQITAGGNHDGE